MNPNELPICPNCKNPIEELKEEYRSLDTYIFTGKKFKLLNEAQSNAFICPKCNQVIPEEVIKSVENLLPVPGVPKV